MTTKHQRQALLQQDLHTFLSTNFPEFRSKQRVLDVPALAKAIGMSAEGAYKWIRSGRMSAEGARRLIELTKSNARPLTHEDLSKYVLG